MNIGIFESQPIYHRTWRDIKVSVPRLALPTECSNLLLVPDWIRMEWKIDALTAYGPPRAVLRPRFTSQILCLSGLTPSCQ